MISKIFSRDMFKRDLLQNDPGQVIEWWERRRLFFNIIVGCTGVITCVAMLACAVVAEPRVGEAIGLPDPPIFAIFGVIAFGIAANICYTGGWIVELLLSKLRPRANTTQFGVRAFRFGLKFSIFITLCPALLSWIAFFIAAMSGQTHAPAGE
jgi:hypothetical protein